MFLDLSERNAAPGRIRSTRKMFLNLSGLEFTLSRILPTRKMFLDLSGRACSWSQFGWRPPPAGLPEGIGSPACASPCFRPLAHARPPEKMFLDLSACSPSRLKARKFRQHIEGNSPQWQSFRNQIDPLVRAVPKEMGRPIEMPHSIRIEAH